MKAGVRRQGHRITRTTKSKRQSSTDEKKPASSSKTRASSAKTREKAKVGATTKRATSKGRIHFTGNPWPNGHALKEAMWSAALEADGLYFHLHVVSANYDAENADQVENEIEDEGKPDWQSRIVWTNYAHCTMSSTKWDGRGFRVATAKKPIDLEKLAGRTYRVDSGHGDEIEDGAELAFGIYLLGHDSVAKHRITFSTRKGPRKYDVSWTARVALSYAGSYELAHRLTATLNDLVLDEIRLGDIDGKTAKALLSDVLVDAATWTLRGKRFARTTA